ncbi:carboxypeptidase-like regulatory domain-containing protein [Actinomadura sp. LOL_016]|uniref:carboxypeptidase-like regulatory domain-containing protein n=1 Tax=unclassified Actinomadura TaxID=2626254 RepID=UPI003A7FC89C
MNDDELMSGVRDAFAALDPVPGDVLAAGRAALSWRLPAAALAELSLERGGGAARGTRGRAPRTLAFTCPDATIELEVSGAGRSREISGRVVPAAGATVAVRHRDLPPDRVGVRVEPGGLFCLPEVPAGLVSLVFRRDDGTSVVTSWVRV